MAAQQDGEWQASLHTISYCKLRLNEKAARLQYLKSKGATSPADAAQAHGTVPDTGGGCAVLLQRNRYRAATSRAGSPRMRCLERLLASLHSHSHTPIHAGAYSCRIRFPTLLESHRQCRRPKLRWSLLRNTYRGARQP